MILHVILTSIMSITNLLIICLIVLNSTSSGTGTLVGLHVLFRHGSRTPNRDELFPKDPNINETYSPYGYEQLTNKGKLQGYKLGQFIRQRYHDFIPLEYNPNFLYASSTNFRRNKMSLQLVLAALFPPLPNDMFSVFINWQPIPYNVDKNCDLIQLPKSCCITWIKEYYQYILSQTGQKIISQNQAFYGMLTGHSGVYVRTPEKAFKIYRTLSSQYEFGLKLPLWTNKIFPQTMESIAAIDFHFMTATTNLRKFLVGKLLKKIIDDSLSGKSTKLYLYSAHAGNIAGVLITLGLFDGKIPPFGSAIFFEIHKIDGKLALKLFYENDLRGTGKILTISGCTEVCDLGKFREILEAVLPTQQDLCQHFEEL